MELIFHMYLKSNIHLTDEIDRLRAIVYYMKLGLFRPTSLDRFRVHRGYDVKLP